MSWPFGDLKMFGYRCILADPPWLFGMTGDIGVLSHAEHNFFEAPSREHSRKPDEMHALCERLWPGQHCELFGRQSRPGWDVWGNESTKFDAQESAA
jgi:N6-adenosine-specific RNA methylase IME4